MHSHDTEEGYWFCAKRRYKYLPEAEWDPDEDDTSECPSYEPDPELLETTILETTILETTIMKSMTVNTTMTNRKMVINFSMRIVTQMTICQVNQYTAEISHSSC